jgi:hypothetical protein
METNPDVDNVIDVNILPEPQKKQKVKKPKILIIEEEIIIQPSSNIIVNKGTGAGGSNTNYYGKKFEDKTNNEKRLLENGYEKIIINKKSKNGYCLVKKFEDKIVTFVSQSGLKTYIKQKYNIELYRHPDEAYISEYNSGRKVLKILEKKEQNVEGSVEDKLMNGTTFKRAYELDLGGKFEVFYGYCVNEFLQKKLCSNKQKYITLNKIFIENNISVLFGDDENYFETFDNWLNHDSAVL